MTKQREEYLRTVAEDYGVSYDVVFALADILGEDEDYDGLLIALDDMDC
jgi:hypothetical protein